MAAQPFRGLGGRTITSVVAGPGRGGVRAGGRCRVPGAAALAPSRANPIRTASAISRRAVAPLPRPAGQSACSVPPLVPAEEEFALLCRAGDRIAAVHDVGADAHRPITADG